MVTNPYSVATLAAGWGCSKRHITNMVKRGELTGFRIGKQMRFTQEEVGVPMSEIAAVLGHSDSRTTERVYARFSPTYLQRAVRALG